MLELDLKKADEFQGDSCRTRNANQGIGVCWEYFLNITLRDDVSHCCPAIPGHEYTIGVTQGHNCGSMRGKVLR
jgi:hypothetical protein